MIIRRRAAAAVLAALATAACTTTIDGTLAQSSRRAPSSASASSNARSGATAFPSSGAPPSSAVALVALLEPVPNGFLPGHLAWDRNVTPTVAQFVTQFYYAQDRASELRVVRSEGLQRVAHRVWYSADKTVDIVLLEFGSVAGARTRFTGEVRVTRADRTLTIVSLDGRGTPVAFVARNKDSDGFVPSRSFAQVGRIVVEAHALYSPSFDSARNTAWLRAQIARLP